MIKEGKFGLQEAVWFVTITISTKVFYTSPAILAGIVGTASWYMTLISALTATVGFTFIYLLLKRFPGKDIIEVFEVSLGRFTGFIFSTLLAALMVYTASIRTREFAEVLKVYVLPLTPITFVITIFIGTVVVLNILGLETIVRLSKLSAYIIIFGLIIILVFGKQNYSLHRIFPILGYGIDRTVYNGVLRSSVYGEIILLAVFAGSLQGIKNLKKAGYISLALSGLMISVCLLAYTLTFPYYSAMEIASPMYELATLIDYGRFLQRVEPIFLFIWSISSFISVAAVFCAFVSIYCKMFRMQDTRPVIFAAAIIVFTLSMVESGISDIAYGSVQILRNYGGLVFFIPPAIALAAALIRRKEGAKNA